MKKNLILGILLMTFITTGVFAQTYYVGDESFNLPQISVQGSYLNDATHTNYFACLSNLDGVSNVVSMNQGDKCEVSRTFNPTESELGEHTYITAIQYVSRAWTPSQGWHTISSGMDNSQTYNFDVAYNIPEDNFNFADWISGLVQSIQSFFCDNFGLFCQFPSSGWFYQENPLETSFTGTWSSGTNNLIGGNWNTNAYDVGVGYANLYANYSKPSNALSSSLWQVKDNGGIFNLTIPSTCWNQNVLQFRAESRNEGNAYVYWYCWDGSSWNVLRNQLATLQVYEEAMEWKF